MVTSFPAPFIVMVPLFAEHYLGLHLKHLHFWQVLCQVHESCAHPQLCRHSCRGGAWKQMDAHHEANTAAELFASEKHNLNVSICVYIISYMYMFLNIYIYVCIYIQKNYMGWSLNCNI